tara:strand:+ start:306 stop:569 length:264 start_codon:yes stop_codon:yes gene_type:complete
MGYGYSYEIADLVKPSSPYETRKLHIGIITEINRLTMDSPLHPGSTKYKVFWLTNDGAHVTLWHVGGELRMISPHEGFEARYNKYRI